MGLLCFGHKSMKILYTVYGTNLLQKLSNYVILHM